MTIKVNTANEVVRALGIGNIAKRLGHGYKAVDNWKRRGLPPESYHALNILLAEKGMEAPRKLWRMYELVE